MAGTKKESDREYSQNWGGKRARQGRPKGSVGSYKEVTRNLQVAVRLTPAEKSLLEELATDEGITVSKYIHKKLFG